MKELILDLRPLGNSDSDEPEAEWADLPARFYIESALLDFAGKVIRVRITVLKERDGY